jgi:hypothetical protein
LLPIQKSTVKNFAAADSEIGSQTVALPIQKSVAKNCAAIDSEIDNHKCRHYRFRNQAARNCGAADSKINSHKLCRCQFRNQQPNCGVANLEISSQKLSLPIQKSAARVESFRFYFSFFLNLLAVMMTTTCHWVPTKKRHQCRLTTLHFRVWFNNIEVVSLHSMIHTPTSMRRIGRMTFQCKFVLL